MKAAVCAIVSALTLLVLLLLPSNVTTTALFAVLFVTGLAFVVVYARRGTWYRSPVGIQVMVAMANKALLAGLILAARLFGDYPGREQVVTVSVAILVASSVWLFLIMWRSKRR